MEGIGVLNQTTESQNQDVLGVVVTRGHTPYLEELLHSITQQTRQVQRLVVVDVSANSASEPLELPDVSVEVVPVPKAKTFGSAVNAALKALEYQGKWLWLFHDDALAQNNTLEALLRAVEHTANVSVVGSKQHKLDCAKELINVGYTASRQGTPFTGLQAQEFDQGQHDSREDVYAVSLNGALVSASLWAELKGTESAFGKYLDSLDFCRRARLAGHRVIVETQAIVHHAQAEYMDMRRFDDRQATPSPSVLDDDPLNVSFWPRLKSSLLFGATDQSVLLFPLVWLAALLLAPLRMLYRLLNKAPKKAAFELLGPLWLLAAAPTVMRIRARIARAKKVSNSDLNPLIPTSAEILNAKRDRRLARNALRKKLYGPTDLDRAELRALSRKRAVVLGLIVAVSAGFSVFAFRDLYPAISSQHSLVGGAMLSSQGGWSELWQHWTSGWIRDGLGASAPSDPLLTVLTPLMFLTLGNMQLAVNLVFLGSLVGSTVGAWFAAGTVSRSVTARAWTALLWAASPTFLFAIEQGRLGAVIAHSALPWLVLAVMRGVGVHKVDARSSLRFRHEQRQEEVLASAGVLAQRSTDAGRTSLTAIGAAALIFAVIVAAAPVLLLPGLIVFVIGGLFSRFRSLLVVPIPALVLLGPVLFRGYVNLSSGGWRVLFSDPGAPFAYSPARPWELALGVPSRVQALSGLDTNWSIFVSILPYLSGGLLVVGAFVALARRGRRAGQIRGAWWIAVLGLATALLSASVVVAAGESGTVLGWAGSGLSVLSLGLLGACLLASDEVAASAETRSFGWRQVSLAFAAVFVFVAPITTLAVWSGDRDIAHESSGGAAQAHPNLHVRERGFVPAVAQQMQSSGRQARVLAISPVESGKVSYQMLHGDGVQLMETSTVVDIAHLGGRPDDIATLVAHLARGLEQDGHAASAFQLAQLGIGAVLVPPANNDESDQLVGRLDAVEGLQRITENETGTIWRVDPRGMDPALAQGLVSTVASRNQLAQARFEESQAESSQSNAGAQEPSEGGGSEVFTPETNTLVVAGEPAWAVTYSRGAQGELVDPVTVEAQRLRVSTEVSAGADSVLVLAENSAPGWQATLGGKPLQPTDINGLQAFELPQNSGGQLEVTYERSSRTAWLALQAGVLLIFGVLAFPVRRKGEQR